MWRLITKVVGRFHPKFFGSNLSATFTFILYIELMTNQVLDTIFNSRIQAAIRFATQVHEIDQKQKRKGKDIPYLIHPLTVGLILAKAGASDDIIMAGILHDTIEDSVPTKKVTREMLEQEFGPVVAEAVDAVTEQDKGLPWKARKLEALEHIKTLSGPALWVKSADTINNVADLLNDYAKDGDATFERFNASKEDVVNNYKAVIEALVASWGDESVNMMLADLRGLGEGMKAIGGERGNW